MKPQILGVILNGSTIQVCAQDTKMGFQGDLQEFKRVFFMLEKKKEIMKKIFQL